jgi:hypothetical protein
MDGYRSVFSSPRDITFLNIILEIALDAPAAVYHGTSGGCSSNPELPIVQGSNIASPSQLQASLVCLNCHPKRRLNNPDPISALRHHHRRTSPLRGSPTTRPSRLRSGPCRSARTPEAPLWRLLQRVARQQKKAPTDFPNLRPQVRVHGAFSQKNPCNCFQHTI